MFLHLVKFINTLTDFNIYKTIFTEETREECLENHRKIYGNEKILDVISFPDVNDKLKQILQNEFKKYKIDSFYEINNIDCFIEFVEKCDDFYKLIEKIANPRKIIWTKEKYDQFYDLIDYFYGEIKENENAQICISNKMLEFLETTNLCDLEIYLDEKFIVRCVNIDDFYIIDHYTIKLNKSYIILNNGIETVQLIHDSESDKSDKSDKSDEIFEPRWIKHAFKNIINSFQFEEIEEVKNSKSLIDQDFSKIMMNKDDWGDVKAYNIDGDKFETIEDEFETIKDEDCTNYVYKEVYLVRNKLLDCDMLICDKNIIQLLNIKSYFTEISIIQKYLMPNYVNDIYQYIPQSQYINKDLLENVLNRLFNIEYISFSKNDIRGDIVQFLTKKYIRVFDSSIKIENLYIDYWDWSCKNNEIQCEIPCSNINFIENIKMMGYKIKDGHWLNIKKI
jgi:hypothetical protein